GEAPLLDIALGDRVVAPFEGALAGASVQRRLGRGVLARQGQVLLLLLRGGGGALIAQGPLGGDRCGSGRMADRLVRRRVPGALGTLHISGRHQPTAPSTAARSGGSAPGRTPSGARGRWAR